ncbi:MAG: sugar phosphate isomerase/epimerase [Propionibacteriaceae bacterium]|jgi:sugar phosphate isomerase/epimerase|nr:sugar phosphate isomerase/epimerase [Propionibacteriaceae bacterium]
MSRLSLNTATCKRLNLAQCVEAATGQGLEAIGPWRDRVQEVGVDQAARLISQAGLRVSTLCRGGFLTSREPDQIAAALADNRRAIDEAATLGAPELVLVVGGLPAAFARMGLPHTDQDTTDKDLLAARQRMADHIGALVPHAREHGVRLALEPMHPLFTADRGVLTTLAQALAIAADHRPEEVGVVVDTYHVWWDPAAADSIAQAGAQGRISSYQVCDWILPLAADPLNSRGMMGDGHIDFPTITGWVAAAGYTGDIEVEIFNEDIWAQPGAATVAQMRQRYGQLIEPYL